MSQSSSRSNTRTRLPPLEIENLLTISTSSDHSTADDDTAVFSRASSFRSTASRGSLMNGNNSGHNNSSNSKNNSNSSNDYSHYLSTSPMSTVRAFFPRSRLKRGVCMIFVVVVIVQIMSLTKIPPDDDVEHVITVKDKPNNDGSTAGEDGAADDAAADTAARGGSGRGTNTGQQQPTTTTSSDGNGDTPTASDNNNDQQDTTSRIPDDNGKASTPAATTPTTTTTTIISRKPPPLSSMMSNNNGGNNSFVERWCDLRGVAEWIPTPSTDSTSSKEWQLRAPYFMIPGAKHAGGITLASLLMEHPAITGPARSLELHTFLDQAFARYVTARENKILVLQARERMYARDYPVSKLKRDTDLVSVDASSSYLYYSNTIPYRILCVIPWIRFVVVLQNPVDRLYQHYWETLGQHVTGAANNAKTSSSKAKNVLSFDDWIAQEFELLVKVGLVEHDPTHYETLIPVSGQTDDEEDVAWYTYQTMSVSGAIGRSLYSIQLRQWFQALTAAGRQPSEAIWVVRTEDLANELQPQYDQILQFLRLAPHALPAKSQTVAIQSLRQRITQKPSSQSSSSSSAKRPSNSIQIPMNAKTRQLLDRFFVPYNLQLKQLLQAHSIPWGTTHENPPW